MFCLPVAVFVSNCSRHPEEPRQWPSFLPLGELSIVGVAITVSHAGFVPWLWQAHPTPARRLPHLASWSVGLFCHRSLWATACLSVVVEIVVAYTGKQHWLVSSKLASHTGMHTLLLEEGRLLGLRALPWPPRLHSCNADFHSSSLEDVMGLFLSLWILPCSFRNREKSCHFNFRHNSEEFPANFIIPYSEFFEHMMGGEVCFSASVWLGIVSYLSKWDVDLTFCNLVLPIMSFNSIILLIW